MLFLCLISKSSEEPCSARLTKPIEWDFAILSYGKRNPHLITNQICMLQSRSNEATTGSPGSTGSLDCPMVFKLAPQLPPDNFHWNKKYYHLTYKDHLPLAGLLQMVAMATSVQLVGYSWVHEDTSKKDANGFVVLGYKHTHLALMFATRLNLVGSDKFDFSYQDAHGAWLFVHCHVQPVCTIAHLKDIYVNYHPGRKYSLEDGKYIFQPPLAIEQKLPAMFDFSRALYKDIETSNDLVEGCMAGKVRVRTVNDVRMIMEAAAKAPKPFVRKFAADSFHAVPVPAGWTCLHISGPTNIGKTKWALYGAGLEHPLLIKPCNSIGCLEQIKKQYRPGVHDSLVLDELDLRFLPREAVIGLADFDEGGIVDVRFTSFWVPAEVKKIFISNAAGRTMYPKQPDGTLDPAIERRVQFLELTGPTYKAAPAAQQAAAAMNGLQLTPHTQQQPQPAQALVAAQPAATVRQPAFGASPPGP